MWAVSLVLGGRTPASGRAHLECLPAVHDSVLRTVDGRVPTQGGAPVARGGTERCCSGGKQQPALRDGAGAP